MIERMDKVMLALQAAAAGRKLYGLDHPISGRQLDLAAQTIASLHESRRELRLVRLDNALMFDDVPLPSSVLLAETLVPRLASHGIEWIEFRAGVARSELSALVDQLERTPSAAARLGTQHVRVGRLGRSDAGDESLAGMLEVSDQASQLQQIWNGLRTGERPDEKLAELVESIRLAVAVGADVCNQLAMVKSHDEYTFVHTVNVSILSAALGEAVGMSGDQVFDLTLAALLHDVGKQRTPLEILNKAGRLDDSERRKMEQHTIAGAAILLERRGVPDVAPIVAFEHHANVDGTGYPRLPRPGRPHLASQIVHVADVFDALRTNRPYRGAMEDAQVRKILLEGSGKQFDPALVDLFLDRVIRPPAPIKKSA